MENHATLDSQAKLGARAKINQKTVSRYLAGTHEATIGNVHMLAKAFELETWQLLTPNLDPKKPPTLAFQTEAELREFYKNLGKTKEAIDGVLRRDGGTAIPSIKEKS